MVYAWLLYAYNFCRHRLVADQAATSTGHTSDRMPEMLRWHSFKLFPLSALRGEPQAQLPQLQPNYRA
jgi:hypothetical protein